MEREERVEELARQFTQMPADIKDKMAWYLLGRQEEKEKYKRIKLLENDRRIS